MPLEANETTEDRTHLLKDFVVEFRLLESEHNELFQCWAEDAIHAINQVLSAYPGCVDYFETVQING